MRDLIRADLRRILRQRKLYLVLLILFIYIIVKFMEGGAGEAELNATAFMNGMHGGLSSVLTQLLIIIPIFFAVFAAEPKARTMQCVIGHGLTRERFVAAKLLDAAILVCLTFIIACSVYLMFLMEPDELGLSSGQVRNAYAYMLLTAFKMFGFIVFSAMIFFITNSTAAGVVTCVFLTVVFKVVFGLLDLFFNMHIGDYLFDGQIDQAYTLMEAGGSGGLHIFFALLYIVAAIAVTVFFFERKELEF